MSPYLIRRLRAEDAPGVGRLVRRVWGDDYVDQRLYDPEALLRANEAGLLISVVGLYPDGHLVAHDALRRTDQSTWAETCAAMVDPAHRGQGLMTKTRHQVVRTARELGLDGVFGHPVTEHVLSQKVYLELGFTCLGLLLGEHPARLNRRVPTAWASRRGSSLLYGLRLRPPPPSGLFAPARYASLIRALQARFSGPDGSADDDVPTEAVPPSLRIQYQSQGDHLVIDQLDPGFDPDSDWRSIRRAIGRHAVTEMRMPLDHAATPEWCSRVEHEGFFFAGLVPSLTQRRDLICYRRLLAPPVPVIRYADASAKALLDAILGDYQRVHGESIESLFEPGHSYEPHSRA